MTGILMKTTRRASGPKAKMGKSGLVQAQIILLFFYLLTCLRAESFNSILYADPSKMDAGFGLPLSVSSINCNSLNMSNTGSLHHKLKMYGITKLKSDIILLCDIRLSNSQNVPNTIPAKVTFRTNPYGSYEFYSNSTKNKRGVGILLKKSCNFVVLDELRDVEKENFLILRLQQLGNNSVFYVGAIYGPNGYEPGFFTGLKAHLRNIGNIPIILGGDWNCSKCGDPVRQNVDLVNMTSLPNKRHTDLLNEMCEEFLLSDPYRVKFPNKIEYTYIPSDVTKLNRSRLDFFIMSRSILNSVSECSILPGLQNKLFDHLAIELLLNKKKRVITPPTISKSILKDPETELVGGLAAAETYLNYSSSLNPDSVADLTLRLGLAWRDLREAGPSNSYAVPGDRTELQELTREAKLAGVREFLEFFPFDVARDGNLTIGDDIFMECLMNGMRNEIVSYQTFIQKNVKTQKRNLISRIESLKNSSIPGTELILELERTLNRQLDLEMRTELENHRNFEYLNDEKITPYFVNLAKCNNACATTDSICDSNGQPFANGELRNAYVREFYADLYKIPEGQVPAADGCIEAFLGPEICVTRLVQESKIPEIKKTELERDISIEELDVSALQGNKSAAGMDGLSNCFIKKFWQLLRTPLHRYLKKCLLTGSLTNSFKTAKIRIIPKKGDSKKIGNWRPISLLSCLYKVLSRALNNRLKKVRDIIFSRAQKGFTNERHIQEVLMNVIEGIAHCKESNIPACILSIDQAKAFDSVSHSYKEQVFKFFGFGPNFIHLMKTLCTNRTVCIVFDDGSLSSNFNLERGDAQGNTPSPILYNIAQQIFLFKLELCPEIKSVFVNYLVPRPLEFFGVNQGFHAADLHIVPEIMMDPEPEQEPEQVPEQGPGPEPDPQRVNQAASPLEFRNESNRETDKAEAFADDATGLTKFERESLITLKKILTDWGEMSGLK